MTRSESRAVGLKFYTKLSCPGSDDTFVNWENDVVMASGPSFIACIANIRAETTRVVMTFE